MKRVFAVTALLAITGAVTALIGTQTAWARGTIPGRDVPSGAGTFRFPDQTASFDANDVSARSVGLAVLTVVLTTLPLLVGPRARPVLYAAAVVCAGLLLGTIPRAAEPSFAGVVSPAPGRAVTAVGAALVMAASLIAIGPSSGVARLGMPERAPS